MKPLKFLIPVWALLLSLLGSSYAQPLQEKLDAIIDQTLPNAIVGVYIKDIKSGAVVYQRNANKLLNPASNIKLLTAAAALYQLGPHYRYVTKLAKQGNNLYLTFSGSPSLTIE